MVVKVCYKGDGVLNEIAAVTTIGSPGSDDAFPSEQAVREALTKANVGLSNVTDDAQAKISDLVTTVGSPGADDKFPSEQAVREALTKSNVGLADVTNDAQMKASDVVTTIGSPGSDSKYPSEQAVREVLTKANVGLTNVTDDVQMKAADIVTTVGSPGADDKYPSEQAVREAITASRLKKATCVIDGGGSVITTGIKAGFECPITGHITAARVESLDATSGAIAIAVWIEDYAGGVPINDDEVDIFSIAASGVQSEETGLTIDVAVGDWITFNVDSVTSMKLIAITLTIEVV